MVQVEVDVMLPGWFLIVVSDPRSGEHSVRDTAHEWIVANCCSYRLIRGHVTRDHGRGHVTVAWMKNESEVVRLLLAVDGLRVMGGSIE
jgi:hypothetical protein